jgi:hypothetical protein
MWCVTIIGIPFLCYRNEGVDRETSQPVSGHRTYLDGHGAPRRGLARGDRLGVTIKPCGLLGPSMRRETAMPKRMPMPAQHG